MELVSDTFETYTSKPFLSRSQIVDALRSPSYYFKRHISKQLKFEPTPAMLKGILLHKAILEPETFDKLVVVQPEFGDMRTTKNREEKQNWIKTINSENIIVTTDEMIEIENFRNVANAIGIFNGGLAELSCYSNNRKGRFDYLKNGIIYDLKITGDASLQGFTESAKLFRYDIQAAFYLQLVNEPGARFKFVNFEKKTYEYSITEFSQETLERARLDIANATSIIESESWNKSYGEHTISC